MSVKNLLNNLALVDAVLTNAAIYDANGNRIGLPAAPCTVASLLGTETLVNKTFTAPVLNDPVINQSGVPYTLPVVSTLATKTGVETLTNKTLTAPVLNSPTVGSGMTFSNATAGYVPYSLSYCEHTVVSMSCTGPWSSSFSWTFSRKGNDVIAYWPDMFATSTAAAPLQFAAGSIPARFCPMTNVIFIVRSVSNGSFTTGPGMMQINTDGSVTVFSTQGAAVYAATGVAGTYSSSHPWIAP